MIEIGHNLREFERGLSYAMREQLPFAISRALNDTAHDVATDALRDEMRARFDRPTRFTLNAFRYDRSTKYTLRAVVLPKDRIGGRHYLYVQSEGGARPQTGLEKMLSRRLGYAGQITAITPASGMRRDRHGNMSRGHLNQIVADLGAMTDGYSNSTAASRARNRGRSRYFVPRVGSHLSPGVYERTASNQLRKVLHFTRAAPRYQARFRFELVARARSARIFEVHLSRRLREAWATRRR